MTIGGVEEEDRHLGFAADAAVIASDDAGGSTVDEEAEDLTCSIMQCIGIEVRV